jgi:hypothetical protein
VGDAVLGLLGRAPTTQGIVEVADMAAAIAALEQAVRDDEAARALAEQLAAHEGRALAPRQGVQLRQRVWPFVEMLRRCLADRADVVWGV